MKAAVIGAGGVGGYFGGRLAQSGVDITFVARGAHLQALKQHGLRVDSLKGDFHITPVSAISQPGEAGIVDVILLCVKAWQVPEIAPLLIPLLDEDTFVVPLENGIEAPGTLVEVLGNRHVVGGLCKISSYIAAPGHIIHAGIDPYIAFGELDNHPSRRSQELLAQFRAAGVNADIPADIHRAIWEKFVFIAAVSGVGAVTRLPLGDMRSIPETRQMLFEGLQEIVILGRANGIDLDENFAEMVLANIDSMSASVTASMQRDIMDGRPSELESQNGAVIRLGRALGIPVPVHEFIYASLLPQEQRARRRSEI